MAAIEAVLFDYGMVLSGPPDPAAQKRMAQIFGVGPEEFHAAYWKFRDAYDRGALSGDAYWSEVARELDFPLDAEHLRQLHAADVVQWTQPNQAMIDWAARLQQAGIKTGVLSNIGDAMESSLTALFPWLANFNHHTFSYRLKIAKPDAAIYRHAIEDMGVPAAKILFIDDREENISAARAAGMEAIQYRDHESFLAEMRSRRLDWLLDPPART